MRAEFVMAVEDAEELRYFEPDQYIVYLREQIDERRWHSVHRVVFRVLGDSRYFEWRYRRALTEMQEDGSLYSPQDVTAYEVVAYDKMVTDYRAPDL